MPYTNQEHMDDKYKEGRNSKKIGVEDHKRSSTIKESVKAKIIQLLWETIDNPVVSKRRKKSDKEHFVGVWSGRIEKANNLPY